MASEIKEKNTLIITLSKKEIVDIIGLLTAQLGNVSLCDNMSGASPTISIIENGQTK